MRLGGEVVVGVVGRVTVGTVTVGTVTVITVSVVEDVVCVYVEYVE